ncbi:MAG: TrkA family potassium uptake protein [Desulfovibrionaceae bacterium]|jgi:trk system potassium uptake protein TrkA|nr:TrkA family potassium uptake protein [Desulfovibrionaceae bacterium]
MKRFAVIGLGKFGFHAAKALYEEGNEVVALDVERQRVQDIAPHCTEAVVMDATDRQALETLGLETSDGVIVSTGSQISRSILICLHLHEIGVQRILVKALDEDHAKILAKVGATEVIHPEKDIAVRTARALSNPNVLDFIPLAAGYDLVEMEPPKSLQGKSLQDARLREKYAIHVIAVRSASGEFQLAPPPDQPINPSDVLILLGRTKDIESFRAL